jgi:hypothetical protein
MTTRMTPAAAEAWLAKRETEGTLSAQQLGESYNRLPNLDLDFGESLEMVDSDGGSEGDGEYMDKVFKVQVGAEEFFFRITGTYNSWDSSMWNESFEIVQPVQVMRTEYVKAS